MPGTHFRIISEHSHSVSLSLSRALPIPRKRGQSNVSRWLRMKQCIQCSEGKTKPKQQQKNTKIAPGKTCRHCENKWAREKQICFPRCKRRTVPLVGRAGDATHILYPPNRSDNVETQNFTKTVRSAPPNTGGEPSAQQRKTSLVAEPRACRQAGGHKTL